MTSTGKVVKLSAVLILVLGSLAAAQTYTVTDLGVLSGDTGSEAAGINSSGQVSGCSDTAVRRDVQLCPWQRRWRLDCGFFRLHQQQGRCRCSSLDPGLEDSRSRELFWGALHQALAINKHNEVVGGAVVSSSRATAFTWTKAKGLRTLRTLPGATTSFDGSVNSAGASAGQSNSTKFPNGVAVIWDRSGKIHSLGMLPGGTFSVASGINDPGQVVGQADNKSGTAVAFLWTKSAGMKDLNKLIPLHSGWVLIGGFTINNSGQIVGYGTINGENHGFLLTPKKGRL